MNTISYHSTGDKTLGKMTENFAAILFIAVNRWVSYDVTVSITHWTPWFASAVLRSSSVSSSNSSKWRFFFATHMSRNVGSTTPKRQILVRWSIDSVLLRWSDTALNEVFKWCTALGRSASFDCRWTDAALIQVPLYGCCYRRSLATRRHVVSCKSDTFTKYLTRCASSRTKYPSTWTCCTPWWDRWTSTRRWNAIKLSSWSVSWGRSNTSVLTSARTEISGTVSTTHQHTHTHTHTHQITIIWSFFYPASTTHWSSHRRQSSRIKDTLVHTSTPVCSVNTELLCYICQLPLNLVLLASCLIYSSSLL